jgi:hypothetical protein
MRKTLPSREFLADLPDTRRDIIHGEAEALRLRADHP